MSTETKRFKIEPNRGELHPASEQEWNAALPPSYHATTPYELLLGVKGKSPHPYPLLVRTDEAGNLYLEVKR